MDRELLMIHALSAHEVCTDCLPMPPFFLLSNPTNPPNRQSLKHITASSHNFWLPTTPPWPDFFAQIASFTQLAHLLPPWLTSTTETIQAGAGLVTPKAKEKERHPNGIDSNKAKKVLVIESAHCIVRCD
jgi:hypothetical protein